MCLAVPGRILETSDNQGVTVATVDFGGVTKSICLAYAPDASVGDHVLVHAGFAIAVLDEAAANEALALWAAMAEELDDEPRASG